MSEVIFSFEGNRITIQSNDNQKMKDICNNLCSKINAEIDSLLFLYGGNKLNLDAKLNEITKESTINVLVYRQEKEKCPKCGKILNNKTLDEIILLNENVNYSLTGIKNQIENIMNNIMNNLKDINYINSQLKNINLIIGNINEDLKKMNNQLNQLRFTSNNIIEEKNELIKENVTKKFNNKITCIYNKNQDEIYILYDYHINAENIMDNNYRKLYIEGKNNINANNIDIYINGKKIPFNCKYKNNERGDIKIEFVFNKLLNSTCCMFNGCSSLKFADLSSFNSRRLKSISSMFLCCTSLESVNLASLNTSNVRDMIELFRECSSLTSLDLSSFNTSNVNNMSSMFCKCSSLQSINLSSFDTFNVRDMSLMFMDCISLKYLDLTSFNTVHVSNMNLMFNGCSSLKKKNVKIYYSKKNKRMLDEIY